MISAPNRCPVCRAKLVEQIHGSPFNFETWDYACGARVYRDRGKLTVGWPCGETAMKLALRRLNKAEDDKCRSA